MRISDNGIAFIAEWEGVRLKAYKCSAGVYTIGIGSTRYEDGSPVQAGDVLPSEPAAYALFRNTVGQFEGVVNRLAKKPLNQNQFDALVSLAYNIGVGAYAKSTVAKRVANDPADPSIRNGFMMWVKAGGRVVNGLVRRREAEANIYFS